MACRSHCLGSGGINHVGGSPHSGLCAQQKLADRVEPGRLVPAKFAKSSFQEIFPTNRESAKPPPGLIFAKSSIRKIFIVKRRIRRNLMKELLFCF